MQSFKSEPKMTDVLIRLRLDLITEHIMHDNVDKAIRLIGRTIEDLENRTVLGAEHFTHRIRELFNDLFLMTCICDIELVRVVEKIINELGMQDKIARKYFLENEVENLPFDVREHIVSFI